MLRQIAAALLWLVAAAAIALGAAGIVAGMDTPSADGSDRTGRTGRGDAVVGSALDGVETELRDLSAAIGQLNEQARAILASLSSNDVEAVDAATVLGTGMVADIAARTDRIQDALDAVPIVGTPAGEYELSPATGERYAAYVGGVASARRLPDAWTSLTIASLSSTRMSSLLAAHDEAVVAAAEQGRRAAYARALRLLDDADAVIADARTLRDRLAATVDVATLDEWIDRSADYDQALRALYVAVQRSNGQPTVELRAAMRAEERAKARLPPDTRSLVLIMSDIGQGGMNAAAIEIDQVRADLDDVLRPSSETPPP